MRNVTTLTQSIKPLFILAVVAILLLILGSLPVGSTHAQGGPEPTPTDLGRGGDDDDDDDDDGGGAPPARSVAGISGFVYDYSGGVYEGGITVIFETEGWETEAVTDSNGFYQIRELDTNGGILNLRLPPGVQAAAPDWPVRLTRGSSTEVNLGYYWRDGSSIPVWLKASLDGTQLRVEVVNQTDEAATGGEIRVLSPPLIDVSTPRNVAGATVADYNPDHFQLDVDELAAGESVGFNLPVEANAAVEAGQAAPEIRVTFTYDQQITPQAIVLDAESLPGLPLAAIERVQSREPAAVSEANQVVLDSGAASDVDSPADGMSSTPAESEAGTATTGEEDEAAAPAPAPAEGMGSSTETETQKEELLPVTGQIAQPINTAAVGLSIVVLLGIAAGGFLALRDKPML